MNAATKFLIIRLSSLGDIIHAVPAFQSLRADFPEARIDWLVEERMAFLLAAVEGIDGVITLDTDTLRSHPASPGAWRNLWSSIRQMRAARYDVAIDFQGLMKTAILGVLSGARTRIGFSRELVRERPAHWFYHRTEHRPAEPVHVVALNHLLVVEAGVKTAATRVRLSSGSGDEAAIAAKISDAGIKDFVVINPGGGWPTKCWAPNRYGQLAEKIGRELGLDIVITSGPGESHLYNEIVKSCPGRRLHHFPVGFLQLIPLAKRARLFVGGDTGPYHLACAMGTPTVGILGPTDPVRNGPWSAMDEAVVRVLPCSFCYGRTCPTRNECMDIGVEQVFQAVARRLDAVR